MKTNPRTRQRLVLTASVAVLLAGGLASLFAFRRGGVDFLSFRIMADGVARGINVYDPAARATLSESYGFVSPVGMFYPPATGFVLAPLALLPYAVAKTLWFLITVVTILFGVRALVRIALPEAPQRVWMATAGIVLVSSSLRWGLMLLQGAPFMFGLLCLFVASLHKADSLWPVAIAALATAFKMTLALPFLGLLLLQRRFAPLALSIAVPVLLNALGFLRMGEGAFANYQHDIASLDAIDDNINTPDPWLPFALPRLDWVFLVYGVTKNLAVARIVTLTASAGVALWLLREGLRTPVPRSVGTSAAFLAPLVCLGSLCVYHHQYDVCLFFVPALLGYFAMPELAKPHWTVFSILPLVLMMILLPIGKAESLLQPIFGAVGVSLLKLAFPVALTLALIGSLAILRRRTAMSEQRELHAAAEAPPS